MYHSILKEDQAKIGDTVGGQMTMSLQMARGMAYVECLCTDISTK